MKKILYPVSLATALLLASCSEDRGTTYEVADANENDRVEPNQLNNYNRPGTAATTNVTTETPAQQNLSAEQLVRDYYTHNNPVEFYHFTATERMGGLAPGTAKTAAMDSSKTITTTNNQTGKTQPNSAMPQTTTADTQPARTEGTDKQTIQNSNKGKATTKKTDKKKERLTPYNDN
ncbi:hypothetical protein H7F15_17400 [Pontibacter sp. Tf4]|uniref:hypothetical protein n=1 Tax=Pontibacter sp. Tf4 TaxID=2761620 RepID=UPI0016270102|nr:hypothetical protein [Pontibacter sp. Tf4]MBB6612821.1 hypothetical protein [Pontibacter sp. Tf4]